MPKGDLIAFMIVIAAALAFAEMQVRVEAAARWVVLATLWVITTAMLIWAAYG
jgi:Na+-translocating ferredoxin:NAD+ oxidoreductase RnfA subunit